MAELGTLVVFLDANITGFVKGMKTATAVAQRSTAKMAASAKKAGDAFDRVGKNLTLKLTAPILAVGVAAVKMSSDFERSMNKVQALSQASASDFGKLEQQALDLGRTTQFSASQAADAMGFFALAGFNANQIIGAMPSTLQLAAAAQIGLAEATDITTGILAGYQLKVSELKGANDVLVKAFTSAKLNLSDLGQAFKMAGPVAKAAGIEFDETAAVLGILANAQLQGTQGGTAFRNMLVKLQGPAGGAKKIMEEWGITIADAQGNMLPFINILQQFEKAQKRVNNSVEFSDKIMEIFGLRAGPGMQALLGQGSQALINLQNKLQNAGGIAERVAKTQMKGFRGQMIALKSAIEGTAIAIGKSGLLQFMTGIAKRATEFFRRMAVLNPEILRTGVLIAALAAAIGPALIGFGLLFKIIAVGLSGLAGFFSIVSLLLSPIGLLIGLVVAVTAVFAKMVGPIKFVAMAWEILQTAWEFWVNVFRKGVDIVKNMAEGFKSVLVNVAQVVGNAFILLRSVFRTVMAGIAIALSTILKGVASVAKALLILDNIAGTQLATGFADTIVVMNKLGQSLDDFANDKIADTANDMANNWNKGLEGMTTFTSAAFTSLKSSATALLAALETESEDKAVRIAEIMKNIFSSVKGAIAGVQGAGAQEDGFGPGAGAAAQEDSRNRIMQAQAELFAAEKMALEGSHIAWAAWVEKNQSTATAWTDIWGRAAVGVANGLADGFADAIVSGKSFGQTMASLAASTGKMLISQSIKTAIASLAIKQTETAGNAVAAAPHPFLIPLFVGIALAAFSSAISKTKGSSKIGSFGGGGGGGAATIPDAAAPEGAASLAAAEFSVIEGEGDGAAGAPPIQLSVQIDGREIARAVTVGAKDGAGDGVDRPLTTADLPI